MSKLSHSHRRDSSPPRATPARPSLVKVVELAVNLDDVSAQIIGHAQQSLLEAGALDVWTVPIGMKKQRPGVMFCALCEPARRVEMARLIMELTGSFGVRCRLWHRLVLERRHQKVSTRLGLIRLKIGVLPAEEGLAALTVVQPEYEDVRALAQKRGVSLPHAMQAAQAAADQWRHRSQKSKP